MNVVPISGGVAVAGPPPGQSNGGPAVLYIVRGDRVLRHFRITGQTFQAGTGTTLWQASQPDSGAGWVQKIDLTGKALTPRYPLPNGRIPIRGTVVGLLTSAIDGSDRVQLWDPATGTVKRTFGRLIAADATRLAWTDSTCGSAGCALHVTDLPSITTTFVDVPHPEAFNDAFSPAQNPPRLAVAVTEPGRIGHASTVQHVYEFDLSSGAVQRMPGLQLPAGADLGLVWSPDGRRLFIISMQAATVNRALAVWIPGAPTLNMITTDLPTVTIATATPTD